MKFAKLFGIWGLIIAGVLVDLLLGLTFYFTGSSGLVGILPRMAMLMLLIYYFIRYQKGYLFVFNFVFLYYFGSSFIVNFFRETHFHTITPEVITKLIFLPLSTGIYSLGFLKGWWDLKKIIHYLLIAATLLSFGIIIPFFFDIGFPTYFHEGVFGWRGILLNPNDIAASFVVAIVCGTYSLFSSNRVIYSLQFVVLFAAMMLLATRASTFGALLGPALCYLFMAIIHMSYGKIHTTTYVWVTVLSAYVIAIPYAVQLIMENEYMVSKILNFISSLSARENQTNVATIIIFEESNLVQLLFGYGPSDFFYRFQELGQFGSFHDYGKRTEVDWIDIWGSFGVVGLTLVYFNFAFGVFRAIQLLFGNPKNHYIQITFIVVFISFVYSLVVGHVVFSPMPIIFISPFLGYVFTNQNLVEKV